MKRLFVFCLICLQTACIPGLSGGYVRERGELMPRPTGAPQNECEEKDWIYLAPGRVAGSGSFSVGDTYGNVWTETVRLERTGIVALRTFGGLDEALTAQKLEPDVGGELLEERIDWLESVERQRALSQTIVTTGFIALTVGLAVFIPALFMNDDTPTIDGVQGTVLWTSLAVFTIGGIMAPLGLLVQPMPEKRAQYAVRTYMLTEDTTEAATLAERVDEHNLRVRSECQ
jgi:hypothetical protein